MDKSRRFLLAAAALWCLTGCATPPPVASAPAVARIAAWGELRIRIVPARADRTLLARLDDVDHLLIRIGSPSYNREETVPGEVVRSGVDALAFSGILVDTYEIDVQAVGVAGEDLGTGRSTGVLVPADQVRLVETDLFLTPVVVALRDLGTGRAR